MCTKKNRWLLVFILSLVSACGGGSDPEGVVTVDPIVSDQPDTPDDPNPPSYVSFFNVTLSADGVDSGEDPYTLISQVLGERSQETPDLYEADHQEVKHILEDSDDEVGEHFVFLMHLLEDGNRGVYGSSQRNEIKVHGGSDDELKGFEETIFDYKWKMKINSAMEVSSNFTHFFQLKPVGGDDGTPTFTITGAERSGEDVMEIRYQVPEIDNQILASIPWETFRGKWLDIHLQATFADQGRLEFSIRLLSDQTELVSISETEIDLWIGEDDSHYQRPKWGIVRSVEDAANLRIDEERVRFADFEISRLEVVE